MTTFAKPEPTRDRWGRPLIVPADGGKAKPYDRISGMSSAVDDRYALELWGKRMVAQGLTMRPDLIAEAVAAKGDKAKLNKVAEAAIDAAKGDAAARMGTALHSLCEQLDAGDLDLSAIPADLAADVRAYQSCLSDAGIKVLESEQFVVCEKIGCAGTLDRLLLLPDGRKVVGDIKTGQSVVEFGAGSTAIQVAIYAHAETIYNPDTKKHTDRDQDIDSGVGILIALPAGSGTCTLHELDLVAGWEAAQMARQVKTWRKRKDLARPYERSLDRLVEAEILSTTRLSPTRLAPSREWLRSRYDNLTPDALAAFKARAKATGLVFFDKASSKQLDDLDLLLGEVERDFAVPFHPAQPQEVPAVPEVETTTIAYSNLVDRWHALDDDSPAVTDEDVEAMAARLKALPPDADALGATFQRQARDAGLDLRLKVKPTARRFAVMRALCLLLEQGCDISVVNTCLNHVADPVNRLRPTGTWLALLTTDEAQRLGDLALAIGETITIEYPGDVLTLVGDLDRFRAA